MYRNGNVHRVSTWDKLDSGVYIVAKVPPSPALCRRFAEIASSCGTNTCDRYTREYSRNVGKTPVGTGVAEVAKNSTNNWIYSAKMKGLVDAETSIRFLGVPGEYCTTLTRPFLRPHPSWHHRTAMAYQTSPSMYCLRWPRLNFESPTTVLVGAFIMKSACGIECRHYMGESHIRGGRYFQARKGGLVGDLINWMHGHLQNCSFCPPETKQKYLQTLKELYNARQ